MCGSDDPNGRSMSAPVDHPLEPFVECEVTYTLLVGGQLLVVEHVPACVNLETGEEFFAPETVERLHEVVRQRSKPARVIETPVYDFAA